MDSSRRRYNNRNQWESTLPPLSFESLPRAHLLQVTSNESIRRQYDQQYRNFSRVGRQQDSLPHLTRKKSNRMPGLSWMNHTFRGHFVAWCGEFVGTFLFLFFAFSGTQVANNITALVQDNDAIASLMAIQKLLYISLAFGFSLAVNAWTFFRISGGLFNPAVALGLCLVKAMPWVRGALLVTAEILGAIAAAAVVSVTFPDYLYVQTTLSTSTSVARGLVIEMFLTAQLVFTIIMLAAEKHKSTFIAPVGIGLSLFVAELTGVYFTGGSLNPARSFAPNVVLLDFQSYHWIYWVGPCLGAIIAAGFYWMIKKLEYETANPGQDDDGTDQDLEKGPEGSPSSSPPRFTGDPPSPSRTVRTERTVEREL